VLGGSNNAAHRFVLSSQSHAAGGLVSFGVSRLTQWLGDGRRTSADLTRDDQRFMYSGPRGSRRRGLRQSP
jgi:hypothetical protein